MLNGRVRIIRSGLREKLREPKIIAIIIAVTKSFTWTPASSCDARKIAIPLISKYVTNLIRLC